MKMHAYNDINHSFVKTGLLYLEFYGQKDCYVSLKNGALILQVIKPRPSI